MRERDGGGARGAAQLGVDVGDVAVDRVLAEREALGDGAIAETVGDEAEHLELARGERDRGGGGARRRARRGPRAPRRPRARRPPCARARAGPRRARAGPAPPPAARRPPRTARPRRRSDRAPRRDRRSRRRRRPRRSSPRRAAARSRSPRRSRAAPARARPRRRGRRPPPPPGPAPRPARRARPGCVAGMRRSSRSRPVRARSTSPRARLSSARPSWASGWRSASPNSASASSWRPWRRRSSARRTTASARQEGRAAVSCSSAETSTRSAASHSPRQVEDGAVVGLADPGDEADVEAAAERLDLAAPLRGAAEVAHLLAGADQVAAGPARGAQVLVLAAERRGGGLVEAAHARGDLAVRDQRRALGRDREHLEVDRPEPPAELARLAGEPPRQRRVAAAERRVGLEDGEPAVLGDRVELLQQPCGPLRPAAGDGVLAAELEVVVAEPQREPGRAAQVAGLAVAAVGALAQVEAGLDVVDPPRGPAAAPRAPRRSPRRRAPRRSTRAPPPTLPWRGRLGRR